jgi:hypothetical protein
VRKRNYFIGLILSISLLNLSAANGEEFSRSDCTNLSNSYLTALSGFQSLASPSIEDFRKIKRERKIAERNYKWCLKSFNRDFKMELKRIKSEFPRVPGSKESNLSNKLQKDVAIANAILNRESQIKTLPLIPALPNFGNN